jgi:PhnB protein
MKMPSLNPYLNFRNTSRQAMEFYQSVFGGMLDLSTFGEFEGMVQDPSEQDLIMHAHLVTDDGFVLMASDTPSGMEYREPAGFAVSVSGDEEAPMQKFWDALSEGGTVTMPYGTPPWGGKYGMLTDKFGVDWMVAVNASFA